MGNIWLVRAAPYDPDGAAEVPLYFSTGRPDGGVPVYDPGDGAKLWRVKAVTPLNMDQTVFDGEFGGAAPTFGTIDIDLGEADLDALCAYAWDGRDVQVWRGEETASFGSFVQVFAGKVKSVTFDRSRLTLNLSDLGEVLQKPLQTTLYDGSGGAEGGEDLKGKAKPLAFGAAMNVEPVLLNAGYLIYQFHARAAQAVDAVYDRAVPLDAGADRADHAALIAATVKAGTYDTCLAEGLIRLGATPVGPVTADVRGDSTGGYVETVPDIMARLAVDFTDLDAGDLDTAAFTALETANGSPCALYLPAGANVSAADVFTQLMVSVGGYWTMTPAGALTVRQVALGAPVATITAAMAVDVRRLETQPPYWRRKMQYGRAWRVHSADEIAAAAAGSLGIAINREDFTTTSNGKAFLHGLDLDGGMADTDGWYYYGGEMVTLKRDQFADGATLKTSQQATGFIVHDYDAVTASFKDLFAGAAATDISSHTPDIGTSWSDITGITQKFRLNGLGQAQVSGGAANVRVVYRANNAPGSADMFAEFQLDSRQGTLTEHIGLLGRYQSATSFYALLLMVSGNVERSISVGLYRVTGSGSSSSIGGLTSTPFLAGMKFRLTCVGSAITAWVKYPGKMWTAIISETDANIASAGNGGIWTGAVIGSGFYTAPAAKISNYRDGVVRGTWTVSSEKTAVVFARYSGGDWQYDNGAGWSNFTRQPTQLIIGSLTRGASSISSAALTQPQAVPEADAKTVIQRSAFVREGFRLVTSEDAAIKTVHLLAREAEVASLLALESDAEDENDRQHALLGTRWDLYQVTIQQSRWDELGLAIGDTVTLTLPRFGLSGGKDFIIGGRSAGRSADWVQLLLWGGQ